MSEQPSHHECRASGIIKYMCEEVVDMASAYLEMVVSPMHNLNITTIPIHVPKHMHTYTIWCSRVFAFCLAC